EVGLADDDGAGAPQPRHHRRIAVRPVAERRACRRGRKSRKVHIVLDGNRHAEQRPPLGTGGRNGLNLGERFVFVTQADEHGRMAVGLDARVAARDRVGRPHLPGAMRLDNLGYRFGQRLLRYCLSMIFSENRHPLFGIMLYNASPRKSFGTSPTSPAASRMNRIFSPGRRSTRPSPTSRTMRRTAERLENSRLRPSVATPMATLSNPPHPS